MTHHHSLALAVLASTLVLACTSNRAANLRHPVGGTARLTSAVVPPEGRYAAPPRPSSAADESEECRARVPAVEFATGSSKIDLAQELALQHVAKCLTGELVGTTVVLYGRVDPNASEAHPLGIERASRVKERLVAHGVPEDRILVTVPSASMPACERSSRACGVEIVIGKAATPEP